MTSILVIGIDPSWLGSAAAKGYNMGESRSQNEVEASMRKLHEDMRRLKHTIIETIQICPDDPADWGRVTARLRSRNWDGISIGGGLRRHPNLSDYFTELMQLAMRNNSQATFLFPLVPDDVVPAIEKYMLQAKFNTAYYISATEEVGRTWSQPLHELSHAEFLKHYSLDVQWFDHAFQIHRKGHVGVAMLRERWLTCNQPYKVTITDIHPIATGTILEGFAEGVFAKDLYNIKATGKEFTYQLCIRLDFNAETGLIDTVNEYYTKMWDTSVAVGSYKVEESREGAPGLPEI